MKQPPVSAQFEITQMREVDFISGVLQRLQDDVGTILGLIGAHNIRSIVRGGRGIGFWAALRMILPIIESVAHVMKIQPQELLGNHLNVSTPSLMWDLFRHSLIHGDYLQEGTYQGKRISWSVGFGAGGHVITNGHIGIDIPTLYQDLVGYLQQIVANDNHELVDVETGVIYGVPQTPKQSIISDFSRL